MLINTLHAKFSGKLFKNSCISNILKSVFALSSVVWIASVIVSFPGCTEDPPVSPTGTVSFEKDILPVFESNCNFPGCHNSTDKQAGIDLTSWNSAMNGSDFGAEIIPYNAQWSHLMQHINRIDTTISPFAEPLMPKELLPYSNGQPLPSDIVRLIASWISQGARNDAGEVAFSNITGKAFITNQSSDLVAVVNLENKHVARLIPVGGRPSQLDAPHIVITDNQGAYFYVSLISEGYVEKYDARTYEKLGRMLAGSSPAHIVISADGSRGYVSNFSAAGSIIVFDTQTMTVTGTITDSRMKNPHGMRLSHDGSTLYAATQASELLYIIRTSDNEILNVVPVDPSVPPNGNGTGNFYPYQAAITPDDRYIFITTRKSNNVRIFDTQSGEFIQSVAVGLNPLALEISPDGRWCYVPNQGSNSVTVIDVISRTVAVNIPNVGVKPHQVDFSADGHYAYVTCESTGGTFVHHPPSSGSTPGTTAVIDLRAGHIKVKDIEMASFPAGISITPGPGN